MRHHGATASAHERFRFRTLQEAVQKARELGYHLPVSEDVSILREQVDLGWFSVPNSLGIHAMEGVDGTRAGEPDELTFRRYRRFAAGGAGLIWVEATAVVEEGRANPRQLWLRKETLDSFRALREEILKAACEVSEGHRPLTVLQLTHSGRYSKPEGKPRPVIAHRSPYLDPAHDLPADYPIITDAELDELQDRFVEAARLARDAGFDAVDVKACHGYLVYELLGAYTRENSKYGGSFENRIRFLYEVCQRILNEVPGIGVVSRLTVYDATPYPYGFGMKADGSLDPDLSEPIELIRRLSNLGVTLINVATGNPYDKPHIERPYDKPIAGGTVPNEHPLANIGLNMEIIKEISLAVPEVKTVFSGISWLRHFIPEVAAGLKKEGYCSIIGVGRGALACPHFARDILETGRLVPSEQCVACSSCSQIMRDGGRAGCMVRDSAIYGPIYIAGRLKDPEYVRKLAEKHCDRSATTSEEGSPAGLDVPAFVEAIARGEDRTAYDILERATAAPKADATVRASEARSKDGRVPKASDCSSAPIKALQRYVSVKASEQGWTAVDLPLKTSGRSVAVVGAGPAGLACAIRLLELGHCVTIYDSSGSAGDMAAAAFSDDRLSSSVLLGEIRSILGHVGPDRLTWARGVAADSDRNLDWLLKKHDAVFIGPGLQASASLSGETHPQVLDALTFLRKVKQGTITSVSGSVAVIGGGNYAMNAAVTAAKLGADDVYVLYRRSYAQMPACPEERQRALEAGVHLLVLQQPAGYSFSPTGELVGVRVIRTKLGDPDSSGRRSFEGIEGTEYLLPVDLVIEAIGQRASVSLQQALPGVKFKEGLVETVDSGYATSRDRVFAGGDIVNGGDGVARAVADGYSAAQEIDRFLSE